ncbi:FG-GAP repeat domain-containing protein [Streptomyces sp. NPDC088745]|uniref:FG-GAP repeat domain-containing protein n=1 Tax=Streptomyces sp. NPDC088745 TaxID=3365884 RepID=UPI003815E2C2
MARAISRTRGRILSRLTVAALAAALVGTTAGAAQAGEPPQPSFKERTAELKAVSPAPQQAARGVARAAEQGVRQELYAFAGPQFYWYTPNGKGGYQARDTANNTSWGSLKFLTHTDRDSDGYTDGIWEWHQEGSLYYQDDLGGRRVGGGWQIYNQIFSPGNLGGAAGYDVLARDSDGVLWLYLGYGDGNLTARSKVGGGWGQYTQITGRGDITGDAKADIVARDRSGTLWLYQGTGDRNAPFKARTPVGGGWNTYNTIVGTGDLDFDGVTDLIARDTKGALWRYSGTGNPTTPYNQRVLIGTSGWNIYRILA